MYVNEALSFLGLPRFSWNCQERSTRQLRGDPFVHIYMPFPFQIRNRILLCSFLLFFISTYYLNRIATTYGFFSCFRFRFFSITAFSNLIHSKLSSSIFPRRQLSVVNPRVCRGNIWRIDDRSFFSRISIRQQLPPMVREVKTVRKIRVGYCSGFCFRLSEFETNGKRQFDYPHQVCSPDVGSRFFFNQRRLLRVSVLSLIPLAGELIKKNNMPHKITSRYRVSLQSMWHLEHHR